MNYDDLLNREWKFASCEDTMKCVIKLEFLTGLEFQVSVASLDPTLFVVRYRKE